MKAPKRTKVTIEVDADTLAMLEVLTDPTGKMFGCQRTVGEVLQHLACSAADCVRRPGSWERPWLVSAFGDEWTAKLEVDPEASWRLRPRKGGAA